MITAGKALLGGGVLLAASKAGKGLESLEEREVGDSSTLTGWVWPLVRWQSYDPVVSDGVGPAKRDNGTRSHNGADIDYRAKSKSDQPSFVAGTRQRSAGGLFFCPDGVAVVAARDGKLWSAGTSGRGWQVVIDHGKPWATYYQHMSRLLVPLASRGVAMGENQHVEIKAGQVIGIIGNDPSQGAKAFNHLHFETWKNGGAEAWVDPSPILTGARALDLRQATGLR